MMILQLLIRILFFQTVLLVGQCSTRYSHFPVHEVLAQSVYLTTTAHQEIVVAYSDKGSDMRENDYLTHVDGVRILNGGLDSFLKSGEKEAVVPVVDETDVKHGGNRLIGFVLIQAVTPRKLSSRRGEVVFDMEEGGPAPTMKLGNIVLGPDGAKTTSDPSYQPPPHGTGPCITGRDCNNYNGTCIEGQCRCIGPYSGSFCQLNRPDFVSLALLNKRTQERSGANPFTATREVKSSPPSSSSSSSSSLPASSHSSPPLPSITDDESPQEESQGSEGREVEREEVKRTESGKKKIKKKKKVKSSDSEDQSSQATVPSKPVESDKPLTVEELYGEGRAYPEPIAAGRPPHVVLRDRQLKRTKREQFLYSVRFRSGPLGVVFDNKINNATIVEKVVRGQQAESSEIKEGDQLVAIESFNVTILPAKVSQRILNDLTWPKTLVFISRPSGEDPSVIEGNLRSRSFNMSIVYPPTLVGEYSFRLGEWSAPLSLGQSESCPIFRLTALDDPFGCSVPPSSYQLPPLYQTIQEQNGFVNAETEEASPFLSLLLQESFTKKLKVSPRGAAVMKRGICTFVEKARALTTGGAELGLIVNNEEAVIDMPAGKEKTSDCSVPVGMMKQSEGQMLHLAARTNEVWAIVTENGETGRISALCDRMVQVIEDLLDKWPNSVPPIPVQTIIRNKPPDQSKVRGLTEEGGRVAVSGENGWAFFDYHLAMFGPQEVPLGPYRLVMALPPFGCDPNAYTVRVADAVVAILRGGGCSFGIKVINAQKLGAKAVMIVNTDDMKTMRLMALPDEVPLIQIPTIMVSRRIQFYLEEQIRPYAPSDHHLVSIQPTGIFGDYEAKNTLQLPQRLQV